MWALRYRTLAGDRVRRGIRQARQLARFPGRAYAARRTAGAAAVLPEAAALDILVGIAAVLTAWLNEQTVARFYGQAQARLKEASYRRTDARSRVLTAEASPNEGPQHKVVIRNGFAVAKFELTFQEWDACVDHGDCPHISDASGWGRGRQPVINVSWDDA
jgi:formylglycine-generating enzyme required for sulfatase activity